MDLFAPKSCRVVSFLLGSPGKPAMQKDIARKTGLSRGMVSRIMTELVKRGFVSRPYRARFVLDNARALLRAWAAARNIRANGAYFAADASILRGVKHAHTLFSGAWIDDGYLKTRFTTVYVEPGFIARLKKGEVGELKNEVILIVAPDDYVFYGTRIIKGKPVVSSHQLFVDLASFGGIAETAVKRIAVKYGFPKME